MAGAPVVTCRARAGDACMPGRRSGNPMQPLRSSSQPPTRHDALQLHDAGELDSEGGARGHAKHVLGLAGQLEALGPAVDDGLSVWLVICSRAGETRRAQDHCWCTTKAHRPCQLGRWLGTSRGKQAS